MIFKFLFDFLRDESTLSKYIALQLGVRIFSESTRSHPFRQKTKGAMFDKSFIVFLCIITIECFVISAGNIFTIFVFWKSRKKLRRTSFLLINLALADLLVGVTTPTATEANFKLYFSEAPAFNYTAYGKNIISALQATFTFASVYFLVLISLERAYALIWPLRHRVASTIGYIYSVIFVWMTGISAGVLSLLGVYGIISSVHWIVPLCTISFFALIIVCMSYMEIQRRLNYRVPAISAAHNNENVHNQSKKLSRTLFIVIAASFAFWFPSTAVYLIYILCSRCVPATLIPISTMLHTTNSLVNPMIYSLRISIFRETLKRMKLCRKSKQYRINYTP